MNESSKPEAAVDFWKHILLMLALAAALFTSIEVVPQILEGATGAILSVIFGGVFLYYFGKHTGSLLAETDA